MGQTWPYEPGMAAASMGHLGQWNPTQSWLRSTVAHLTRALNPYLPRDP